MSALVTKRIPPRHRFDAREDVEELVTLVARQSSMTESSNSPFLQTRDRKYFLKEGTRAVLGRVPAAQQKAQQTWRESDRRQALRGDSEPRTCGTRATQPIARTLHSVKKRCAGDFRYLGKAQPVSPLFAPKAHQPQLVTSVDQHPFMT